MFQKKNALAPAVIAMVAVVLVAVAGVGAYVVLSGSNSSSSTTSSLESSATASTSAALSSGCETNSTSAAVIETSVAPLLNAFSAIEIQYNATSQGQSTNATESYSTVYASSTTYKVNVVYGGEGQNVTTTAWILKNGTVLAIDEPLLGNLTESESQAMVTSLFAGFSAEIQAGSQLSTYTSSQYFHSTGTSSVTIGANTFAVTNYAANALPQTIAVSCGGTYTLTGYGLSVGEPKGTSYDLVTEMQLAESSASGGSATASSYSIQVISFTAT